MMRTMTMAAMSAVLIATIASAQPSDESPTEADSLIAEYFQSQTQLLTDRTFAEIETLEDWRERRGEYQRQLLEMLGLDPMPEKTPLQPVVTGSLEASGVVVEKLHFQSMPGLYVTANLYRPSEQTEPLPAILYVCGHGGERFEGRSLGNKTHYQHHGAWFARNGYVCLTIDTVQLGEIEGIHHGTYREKMWWWNNRGYSSAGAEAYNCIRSLDYLQSRPEVDGNRIGVTGRSGGGAYSWWIAAIDERIKAAVPVAGITSLKNHVVDGCVEGHCDCMYMVNTYQWDFPMVAALVAPRPLLISNSDKDRIFPLDGVVDVHRKVAKIYQLYGAEGNLGLQITEGPHKDTQELRVAAFRWMNRFLRDDTELIDMAARPLFEKRDLAVFDDLPDDERVSTIHESFIPKAGSDAINATDTQKFDQLIRTLQEKCFRGWPEHAEPLDSKIVASAKSRPSAKIIEYTGQAPFRLKMFVFASQSGGDKIPLRVRVLDDKGWDRWAPVLAAFFPNQISGVPADLARAKEFEERGMLEHVVYIMPRGVGPTRWSRNERYETQLRRRFMLLGQTLAGMQIYDITRGLKAIDAIPKFSWNKLTLEADGEAGVWSVYASLFHDEVDALQLTRLPKSNREAPDLLNVSRYVEFSDLHKAATQRITLRNALRVPQ